MHRDMMHSWIQQNDTGSNPGQVDNSSPADELVAPMTLSHKENPYNVSRRLYVGECYQERLRSQEGYHESPEGRFEKHQKEEKFTAVFEHGRKVGNEKVTPVQSEPQLLDDACELCFIHGRNPYCDECGLLRKNDLNPAANKGYQQQTNNSQGYHSSDHPLGEVKIKPYVMNFFDLEFSRMKLSVTREKTNSVISKSWELMKERGKPVVTWKQQGPKLVSAKIQRPVEWCVVKRQKGPELISAINQKPSDWCLEKEKQKIFETSQDRSGAVGLTANQPFEWCVVGKGSDELERLSESNVRFPVIGTRLQTFSVIGNLSHDNVLIQDQLTVSFDQDTLFPAVASILQTSGQTSGLCHTQLQNQDQLIELFYRYTNLSGVSAVVSANSRRVLEAIDVTRRLLTKLISGGGAKEFKVMWYLALPGFAITFTPNFSQLRVILVEDGAQLEAAI